MSSVSSWRHALPAAGTAGAAAPVFSNPVVEQGADPWVIRYQRDYLYVFSRDRTVYVSRAGQLPDIGRVPPVPVWQAPAQGPCSQELWAPELHRWDAGWLIYVAADDGVNENHRMFALQSVTSDPQGPFQLLGQVRGPDDHWAIDGTVFRPPTGEPCLVWSGWAGAHDGVQDLYIARLFSPLEVGPRTRISRPEHPWEQRGHPWVNEGPAVLRHGGRFFIVYSASGSWTDDYCLGVLTWNGQDPLLSTSWIKAPEPAFQRTQQVAGPGHASFVLSPDGKEDWMVYHAARRPGAGWDRQVHIQPIRWDAAGRPVLGSPLPPGVPLPAPSGSAPQLLHQQA